MSATSPVATPAGPVNADQPPSFVPGAENVLPGKSAFAASTVAHRRHQHVAGPEPRPGCAANHRRGQQRTLGVARTYPFNPYVQIQSLPYRKFPGGQPGWAYNYVLLMQTLQLGHQQKYRKEVLAALQTVQWNIHQAELLNLAQTERLYFTALYQRSIRDLRRPMPRSAMSCSACWNANSKPARLRPPIWPSCNWIISPRRMQAQLAEANFQTALLDLRRQLNLPSNPPARTGRRPGGLAVARAIQA